MLRLSIICLLAFAVPLPARAEGNAGDGARIDPGLIASLSLPDAFIGRWKIGMPLTEIIAGPEPQVDPGILAGSVIELDRQGYTVGGHRCDSPDRTWVGGKIPLDLTDQSTLPAKYRKRYSADHIVGFNCIPDDLDKWGKFKPVYLSDVTLYYGATARMLVLSINSSGLRYLLEPVGGQPATADLPFERLWALTYGEWRLGASFLISGGIYNSAPSYPKDYIGAILRIDEKGLEIGGGRCSSDRIAYEGSNRLDKFTPMNLTDYNLPEKYRRKYAVIYKIIYYSCPPYKEPKPGNIAPSGTVGFSLRFSEEALLRTYPTGRGWQMIMEPSGQD